MLKKGTTGVRLTPRDLKAVTWIAEQQAVRLDTVGCMLERLQGHAVDSRSLRRLAERWDAAGLVNRRRILADAPTILWPTAEGLRCAGLLLKPGQRADAPSIGLLAHTLAVAQVRVAYEREGFSWVSERALRAHVESDHLADGMASIGERRVLIEVERTLKNKERIQSILRSNLLTPGIGEVHYWVTSEVSEAVAAAVAALTSSEQARVRMASLESVTR